MIPKERVQQASYRRKIGQSIQIHTFDVSGKPTVVTVKLDRASRDRHADRPLLLVTEYDRYSAIHVSRAVDSGEVF